MTHYVSTPHGWGATYWLRLWRGRVIVITLSIFSGLHYVAQIWLLSEICYMSYQELALSSTLDNQFYSLGQQATRAFYHPLDRISLYRSNYRRPRQNDYLANLLHFPQ